MKKVTLFLLAIAVAALSLVACAEVSGTNGTNVFVTVSVAGELKLACAEVSVDDVDGDGVLTLNDALACAHAQCYEQGAEGFGSTMTEYGLSMTKLWGDESGNFGYYTNNVSNWSLADTVNDGDYITVFVYADTTAWSDMYCYFDVNAIDSAANTEYTLTLTGAGFDESWNAIAVPVEGAVITVNGEATEYVTDSEGKVTITVPAAGSVISATSATATLVPPVVIVK